VSSCRSRSILPYGIGHSYEGKPGNVEQGTECSDAGTGYSGIGFVSEDLSGKHVYLPCGHLGRVLVAFLVIF